MYSAFFYMKVGLHITRGLISRRYDQGLDSIIRLVGDLEARIEDLSALHIATPRAIDSHTSSDNQTTGANRRQ
jgi:hypothetical protein